MYQDLQCLAPDPALHPTPLDACVGVFVATSQRCFLDLIRTTSWMGTPRYDSDAATSAVLHEWQQRGSKAWLMAVSLPEHGRSTNGSRYDMRATAMSGWPGNTRNGSEFHHPRSHQGLALTQGTSAHVSHDGPCFTKPDESFRRCLSSTLIHQCGILEVAILVPEQSTDLHHAV